MVLPAPRAALGPNAAPGRISPGVSFNELGVARGKEHDLKVGIGKLPAYQILHDGVLDRLPIRPQGHAPARVFRRRRRRRQPYLLPLGEVKGLGGLEGVLDGRVDIPPYSLALG